MNTSEILVSPPALFSLVSLPPVAAQRHGFDDARVTELLWYLTGTKVLRYVQSSDSIDHRAVLQGLEAHFVLARIEF